MTKDKEPADPKDKKSTTQKVTRLLPCKLSAEERAKAGQDLEDNLTKIEGIELAKKTADDGFKKDIGLLEEVQATLRSMVRSGAQEREVQCEETVDYRMGEVRVKRLDTEEVFQKRTMAQHEYQLPLEAQKPAGKLLAMDGGKAKDEPCSECHGTGKIQMGDPPLDVKCEGCSGVGTVPAKPDTLKATLADVAATHAQNKAEAEKPVQEGDGHPEVEKLLAKAKKSKGKKEPVEGNGTSVDTSHGPDESF